MRDIGAGSPPPPRDLPGLTSLRAAAALLVFGYHLGSVVPIRIFAGGYVGVAFFFVLSGFLLTWGADRSRTPGAFYLRRVARIYPCHLVVWAAVLLAPIVSGQKDLFAAGLNLGLLQAWSWRLSDVFSCNGVTWSLSCEMFFYLTFPALYSATRSVGLRVQWIVVGAAYAVAGTVVVIGSLVPPDDPLALIAGANPLVRAPEFLLGVVGARTLAAGHRITRRAVAAVLLLAGTGLVLAHGSPAGATWAAPVFLLVITAVAQYTVDGRRPLAWRWAIYAGKVSFCFYLVHQLVLKQTFAELGEGLGAAVLALGLSVAIAAALHHAVEVPANRALLSWARRARPRLKVDR